ncbi:MAG: hypothetical protein Q8R00_04405 [Candidatus Nanoarchaeia archaeon]|nr:hypothetical protein [Candidatus Nanoarchaeia archaeon]
MQDLVETLKKVESSSIFKEQKEKHKEIYLASFFKMADDEKEEIQLHYYNPETDKMILFIIADEITSQESEVFKQSDAIIKELKLDEVKINFEEASKIISKLLSEKYNHESPNKRIFILQNLEKPIWNITYLTTSINLLNVKINAITGEIISENITPALQLGKVNPESQ